MTNDELKDLWHELNSMSQRLKLRRAANWNNPDYPNCARLLKQHHKIVSDAKVKAEEMRQ